MPSHKTITTLTKRLPAFFSTHWEKDGQPSGSFWHGKQPPNPASIPEGCFCVYHPENEIEITMLPCLVERKYGSAYKILPVDLALYMKRGERLSFRQRLRGII